VGHFGSGGIRIVYDDHITAGVTRYTLDLGMIGVTDDYDTVGFLRQLADVALAFLDEGAGRV